MNDLLTIEGVARLYQCSVARARDVILKRTGFPAPAPGSTLRHRLWLNKEVRAFRKKWPEIKAELAAAFVLKSEEIDRRLAANRRHHHAKRRTAKMVRTPPWADMEAIRAIYLQALRVEEETGVKQQVDHIIPLQGRLVSGLHVHNNLQVLPKVENARKNNRYEVEV